MIRFFRVQWWKHKNRLHWWQRRIPIFEYPTTIYSGLPGSGKTLLMVRDCIRMLRVGFRVYSNMAIHDPLTGRMAGGVGSWVDMLRLSVEALEERADRKEAGLPALPGVVFAFDELHLICDAREWQGTPKWWLNLIAQRRHFGVGVIGTTQVAGQVEKRLRTLMDLQVSILRPWKRILGLRRFPVFRVRELDPVLIEADPLNAESRQSWMLWMPWYAYAGYSTSELIISDDWAAYSDTAIQEEISKLTVRAKVAADRLGDAPLIFPPGPGAPVAQQGANGTVPGHPPYDTFSPPVTLGGLPAESASLDCIASGVRAESTWCGGT